MKLNNYIVSVDISVLNAMDVINEGGKGIVYVCKNDNELVGTVTDGNIRRYILSNGDLSAPVTAVVNRSPKTLTVDKAGNARQFMIDYNITSVPILDKSGKILSIQFLHSKQVWRDTNLNIPVVIMAGGRGTRLYPYTQVLPKPLIPIGEKTIIEWIMDKFEGFGCNNFDVIVNYKRNIIKSFFMDCEPSHHVTFTDENEFMGTGGGLRLLQGKYNSSFFMTNCDVLLEADYGDILNYHRQNRNIITMVCAMKKVVIPYGTVELDVQGSVINLQEKPNLSFLTNTGVYVIEPEFIDGIPENQFIHITDIIQQCVDEGKNVGAYPVSEQAWMDMGQIDQMEDMKKRLIK